MRKHMKLALIAFLGLGTILSPVVGAATSANAAAAGSAATLFDYNNSLSKEDFSKTVIMEIGQERFFIGGSGGESPFTSYNPYPGTSESPFHWFTVSDTQYLVFHIDAEVGEDSIYQYQDGTLKLIYSNPIFDVKFTSTAMYILVNGPGADPWPRVDEHSNLLKVSLQDNAKEYLGVKRYIWR